MKVLTTRFSVLFVSICIELSFAFSELGGYNKEILPNIGRTEIKSENYPKQYPKNYERDWEIVQNFGNGLKVVIEELSLEKHKSHCFDKLYFTAKISSNTTVDYKPCAGENEKLINNTFVFNFEEDSLIKLNINFKSDANTNFGANERFKFTVIPICEEVLQTFENGSVKFLNSPLYPNPYPVDIDCKYVIKASSDDKLVKIVLRDLNLSERDTCNEDRIIIKDLSLTNEFSFCNEKNYTWISKSNTAVLNFASYEREDQTKRSFQIEFSEISEFEVETPDFVPTTVKPKEKIILTTKFSSSSAVATNVATVKEKQTNKVTTITSTTTSTTTVLDPSNAKISGNDKEIETTESSLTTVVVLILLAIIVICATVVFVVVRLRKKPRESRFFDAPPVRWSANRSSSNLSLDVQNEEERVRRENPYAEIPAANDTNVYHGIDESMDEIDRIKKGLASTTQVEEAETPPPLPGQHPSMKNTSPTFDMGNNQPSTSNDFRNHHYGNIAPTCDESDDEVFNNVASHSAAVTSPQNHESSLAELKVFENPYVEDPTSATENNNGESL